MSDTTTLHLHLHLHLRLLPLSSYPLILTPSYTPHHFKLEVVRSGSKQALFVKKSPDIRMIAPEIPSIPNKVFGEKTTFYRSSDSKGRDALSPRQPPPQVSSPGKKKAVPGGGKTGQFIGKTSVAPPGSTIKVPDRGVVEKVMSPPTSSP
jgi:hypothetical protein